ncbi:MAG: hypothetical protein WCI12_03990 [Actinomycetes bacterium]
MLTHGNSATVIERPAAEVIVLTWAAIPLGPTDATLHPGGFAGQVVVVDGLRTSGTVVVEDDGSATFGGLLRIAWCAHPARMRAAPVAATTPRTLSG